MKRRFLLSIGLLLAMTGCSKKVVNEIQIVETIAFDRDDNQMKATALYPRFEDKGKAKLQLLSTHSASYYDLLPRLNTLSVLPIEEGQLRMALFGNAFAKNEEFLTSVLHSLCRDPRIGTRMQLGLADKTAESLLKTVKDSQTPFYLQSLINQNITDGNLPRLNLQIVLANMYGRGRDTYIPYFIQDGADVKIDGLALFNGSRFVHRIGMRDTFLLKILVNPVKNGRYQVELEDEGRKGWALLRNMHAKTRYTVTQIDPVPAVAIDLHMQALLKDLPPWIEIKEKSKVRQIEVQLNKQFQEAIQRLIASFQRYGVDPIGFGDLIQGQARGWDIRSFDKTYPDMKTNVNVKINILQTGSGE